MDFGWIFVIFTMFASADFTGECDRLGLLYYDKTLITALLVTLRNNYRRFGPLWSPKSCFVDFQIWVSSPSSRLDCWLHETIEVKLRWVAHIFLSVFRQFMSVGENWRIIFLIFKAVKTQRQFKILLIFGVMLVPRCVCGLLLWPVGTYKPTCRCTMVVQREYFIGR